MQDIAQHGNATLEIGAGTLYRTIQRLMDSGMVREVGSPPAETLRDERRRHYRLTPAGRRALDAEVHRLEELIRVARGVRGPPGSRDRGRGSCGPSLRIAATGVPEQPSTTSSPGTCPRTSGTDTQPRAATVFAPACPSRPQLWRPVVSLLSQRVDTETDRDLENVSPRGSCDRGRRRWGGIVRME